MRLRDHTPHASHMIKDKFGREINLGDFIAVSRLVNKTSSTLGVGVVVDFTTKTIKIAYKYKEIFCESRVNFDSNRIIVVDTSTIDWEVKKTIEEIRNHYL